MIVENVKKIVENYLNNRQLTSILEGTYKGGRVVLNEKAYLPKSLLKGNLKTALLEGDRVKLLRNDGGREYYILEIVGAQVRLQREEQHEDI